jgi:hypothetical protein
MTTTKDSKKLVQARIDHAKAIGDYLAGWSANDTTAIALIVLQSRLQPTFSPRPF